MPAKRFVWLQRIKDVEREYAATRLATDRLLAAGMHDATVFRGDVRLRDVRHASERLDGTYAIRLFAEFETGLRLFWPTVRGGDPPARTRDLLDGVAATRRIPFDELTNAHAVREYRNSLVHERDPTPNPIPIAWARAALCQYFAFMPLNW